MFDFDWDIISFIQEQYPLGLDQEVGSILTITGRGTDAYMSTVRTYLQRTWPAYSMHLLNSLQGAINSYPRQDNPGSKHFSIPYSIVLKNHHTKIRKRGVY
jgi:hypothetical protein